MTDSRELYNLNQPDHHLVNNVLRRIEAICHENGLEVAFGVRVHNAISQLVEQYNELLSKEDQKSGVLDIENQELKRGFSVIADIAMSYADGHDEINEHTPDAYIKLLEGYLGRISVLSIRAQRGEFPVDE